jgi:hypothetical protein
MDRGTGKPAWKGNVSLGMTGRRILKRERYKYESQAWSVKK